MKIKVSLIFFVFLLQSCTKQLYKIDNEKIINNIESLVPQVNKPKILVLFDMKKKDYFLKENKSRLAENYLTDNLAFYFNPEDNSKYYFLHQKVQLKIFQNDNKVNEHVFPHMHNYQTYHLNAIGNYKLILDFPSFYEQLDGEEQNKIFRNYVFYIAIPPSDLKNYYDIYQVDLVEIERIP